MSAVNQTIGLMFLFWRCSDCLLSSFRSDPAACTGGPSSSRTRRRPCSWQCSPTWATASSPSSATCVTSSATGRSSGATLPERGRSKRWGVRPGVRHRSWAHINQEFKNFFYHYRMIYQFWVLSIPQTFASELPVLHTSMSSLYVIYVINNPACRHRAAPHNPTK